MDSNLLHKESDEAQRQMDKQEGDVASSDEGSGDEEDTTEQDENDENPAKAKSGEKRLRNQFNFSERASQTLNNPYRVSINPPSHPWYPCT